MRKNIHFLHLSDTHWAFEPIGEGIDSKNRYEALRNWIRNCNAPVDFIVHTGDLVHRGQIESDTGLSTRKAWELTQTLGLPLFPVTGNHDNRPALADCFWKNISSFPNFNTQPLLQNSPASSSKIAYYFSIHDEDFVVLDARDTQQIDPQGHLDPQQLDSLISLLQHGNRKLTLFMHYPPVVMDCEWIDRTMTIQNGMELHRNLVPFRDRIRAVFFGHIHRPTSTFVDGILYVSCGSSAMHFPNLPNDSSVEFQRDPVAFANYVTISENAVWIKPQWVSTP
jgi:3',5'-cyclic AMP phosphodiesterase CpdA